MTKTYSIGEGINCILMPQTDTYALGVEALNQACKAENNQVHPTFVLSDGSKIYRPLTFKENIEVRTNNYSTLKNSDGSFRTKEERLMFFQRWLDSSMGIAYQAKTNKFKLISVCQELVQIEKDFQENYLSINYNFLQGIELDHGKKNVKYYQGLTFTEVNEHPAWLAAVENDKSLLKAYSEIVFAERKSAKKLMAFNLFGSQNPDQDQLRALYVHNLGNDSDVFGVSLYDYGSFLQLVQERCNCHEKND